MDHWEQNDDDAIWRWIGPYLITIEPFEDVFIVEVLDEMGSTEFSSHYSSETSAMSVGEDVASALILRKMEDQLS